MSTMRKSHRRCGALVWVERAQNESGIKIIILGAGLAVSMPFFMGKYLSGGIEELM